MKTIKSTILVLALILSGAGSVYGLEGKSRFDECLALGDKADSKCQLSLAIYYADGLVTPKDDAKAMSHLKKSAEQGNAEAQLELGKLYAHVKIWHEAIIRNSPELGPRVKLDKVKYDQDKAQQLFALSAKQGNRMAEYFGTTIMLKTLKQGDTSQLLKFKDPLKIIADQGNSYAQGELGTFYFIWQGFKDTSLGLHYLELASEQGNTAAMIFLGTTYVWGQDVEKNTKLGADYYDRAAKRGDPEGLYNIGYMHDSGEYFKKDPVVAFAYYNVAARSGNREAQYKLASFFATPSTIQDYNQAADWAYRSATQGYVAALDMISQFYSSGFGVPKNNKLAYFYASLGTEYGFTLLEPKRTMLAGKLTDKEMTEVKKMLESWKENRIYPPLK
ncbi:MAG: hypothetical protein QM523_04190 [Candidatus Pacebacteria bacterium]|nr:hypothetical protein [Candidatus Paceibacterota bacterium]